MVFAKGEERHDSPVPLVERRCLAWGSMGRVGIRCFALLVQA
jgi:hypothetical protein